MKKLLYPACFYPCENKLGAYTVVIPDLPGCLSEGNSLEDAIFMATDAASGWILTQMEDGLIVPKASDIKSVVPDSPDGFVNLLIIDIEAYAEKYGEKAIRKNLTIPAWLNTFAEKNNINFSKVLQDALFSMYQQKQELIAK
ncbi:MAG: type II toxin-antitoxin system HicB family antitoxin [Phascolarctobacterium sp.]|nr:type II toxin-antitoxin system HicB family antitoxin [Phascolarctobacterium sp.]